MLIKIELIFSKQCFQHDGELAMIKSRVVILFLYRIEQLTHSLVFSLHPEIEITDEKPELAEIKISP
jgi:hypothetical protein